METITSKAQSIELIDRAIERIEQSGWARGDYRDDSGCYCVLGALGFTHNTQFMWEVLNSTSEDTALVHSNVLKAFNRTLERQVYAYSDIADWNDHEAEDQEDALRVLREVRYDLAWGQSGY